MRDFLSRLKWFYATRIIGAGLLAYGVLSPHDPDRGTLLWIGSAFIGGEFVAKAEPKKG